MAQFRGAVEGSRGAASRLGGKKSGLSVVCDGWHKGIAVRAYHKDGKDIFKVYETAGSTNATSDKLLLIITDD